MTYLHPLKQHIQKKYYQGFTLIELLIVTLFGGIVAAAAGGILSDSLRSGAALETTQRLRMDWNRTSHFIESEVAMSERVFTDESKLNLTQCDSAITNEEFSFGLEIRRHLPPAIYYIRSNDTQTLEWAGESSLWRCGPSIDENGNYTNIIGWEQFNFTDCSTPNRWHEQYLHFNCDFIRKWCQQIIKL